MKDTVLADEHTHIKAGVTKNLPNKDKGTEMALQVLKKKQKVNEKTQ